MTPQQRRRHRIRIAGGDQERRPLVGHDVGDAADIGADDRHAAGERLENRIRHVVDAARIERDVRFAKQHGDPLAIDLADERHAIGDTQLRGQRDHRLPLGAVAGNRQPGMRTLAHNDCKRADRCTDVVDRLEIARNQDVRRRPRTLHRGKARTVDDVRQHDGRDTVAREYVAQETRRHGDRVGARDRRRDPCGRLRQEAGGVSAAIVDDDRPAPNAPDPDRGRGKQVPRPAGIGHDVQDVDLRPRIATASAHREPGGTPRASRGCGRQTPADTARWSRTNSTRTPSRARRSRNCARLVCHAARRRRHRSDQPHRHGRLGAHCASAGAKRAKTSP